MFHSRVRQVMTLYELASDVRETSGLSHCPYKCISTTNVTYNLIIRFQWAKLWTEKFWQVIVFQLSVTCMYVWQFCVANNDTNAIYQKSWMPTRTSIGNCRIFDIQSCLLFVVVHTTLTVSSLSSAQASVTTLAFARDSTFLSNAEKVVLPMVLCLTILLTVFTILVVSIGFLLVDYDCKCDFR